MLASILHASCVPSPALSHPRACKAMTRFARSTIARSTKGSIRDHGHPARAAGSPAPSCATTPPEASGELADAPVRGRDLGRVVQQPTEVVFFADASDARHRPSLDTLAARPGVRV